jgi:hypothetical protein
MNKLYTNSGIIIKTQTVTFYRITKFVLLKTFKVKLLKRIILIKLITSRWFNLLNKLSPYDLTKVKQYKYKIMIHKIIVLITKDKAYGVKRNYQLNSMKKI